MNALLICLSTVGVFTLVQFVRLAAYATYYRLRHSCWPPTKIEEAVEAAEHRHAATLELYQTEKQLLQEENAELKATLAATQTEMRETFAKIIQRQR